MTDATAKSDLPSVVAVGINSKGQRIEFTYGGLSWGMKKASISVPMPHRPPVKNQRSPLPMRPT